MHRTPLLLLTTLLAFAATSAPAQDPRPDNDAPTVAWYTVRYVKFKPGMAEEARKLIYDHYWPIDKEIGRDVVAFDYATGEWDHVAYFPMPGGPAELAGGDSPLMKRWSAVYARREGGKDKTDALDKRFLGMVLQQKTEIVSRRLK